ncbi:MAG: TetR/AcrR family transcriptional regulator [Bacteroidota bacterium]
MSKGTNTKAKIITKSAELFNSYGYHGCSLSDIMTATKLQKGGIYNHFKNKDEIATEAFDYSYNRVIKRFRKLLGEANTPLQKLYTVIDAFASFADDPVVKGGGCPIFNTAMDSTNTHPKLKQKARMGIESLITYVEIKLREGMDAGVFRKDVDIKEFASLLIMTLEGAIIMSRVQDHDLSVRIASDFMKKHIQQKLLLTSDKRGAEKKSDS